MSKHREEAMHRTLLSIVIASLAWLAMLAGTAVAQERRVALVIGNAAYESVRALPNPVNDARAIAATLRRIGFDSVREANDLGIEALRRAIVEFGRQANGADVAIVYFAGHGIEIGGRNMLIPVDARLEYEQDAELEAVPLDVLLNQIRPARRFRLVILDACRDNPFASRMKTSGQSLRSVSRGLARVEPAGATYVAYAAKEGTVARDGEGSNSPYASALLQHMAEPGLPLERLFGRVRDAVIAATGNQQEPFLYGSFGAEPLFLVPPAAATGTSPTGGPTAAAPASETIELAAWNSISASRDAADFEEFLRQFPQSRFAGFARNRLNALRAPAPAAVAPPKQPATTTPAPTPAPPRQRPASPAPAAPTQQQAALAPAPVQQDTDAAIARWQPTRPVRLIVPFAPGGSTDVLARHLAAQLATRIGQPVVVENRPGAAGLIGLKSAADQTPDGHTIAIANTAAIAIAPATDAGASWPALAPTAMIGTTPHVVIVSAASPLRSLADLIAQARARPGALNVASAGNGSFGHLAAVALQSAAGASFVHVPYRGGPAAMQAVLSGEVELSVQDIAVARQEIAAGRARALAVTGAARSTLWPDIPTIAEAGVPGYQATMWIGAFVPVGTPRATVLGIHAEFARALQSGALRSPLSQLGIEPAAAGVDQFAAIVRQDSARWAQLVRSVN
jgi:tripartite-type tricarboxylate transporter receptor subunit TctC/uncharacterized caspase-like protein